MKKSLVVVASGVLLFVSASSVAGTLRIGQPVVQGDQVTIPVLLEGDVAGGVAALSFQLNYDPSALEPRQASPGAAAQSAGKDVMTNVKEPGTYMVVMAGLNNGTLASGEVTNIVLERRGDDASTNISITGATFASLQGDEIPSRGSTGNISFEQAEEDDTESDEEQAPSEEEQAPDQGDAEGENKGPEPVPVTAPEAEPAPRRTADTVDRPQRDTAAARREPVPASDGGISKGASDAEASKELADALTAAAEGRLSIGARSSETRDAAQAGVSEANRPAGDEPAPKIQVAAVSDTPGSGAAPEAAAPVADGAVQPPAATAASAETASAGDAPSAAMPEAVEPGDATRPDSKGRTSTLVFLGVIVAVVAGIVVLRKRLFA